MTEPAPGLTDLMVRVGGLVWVSEQLFAIEGRWATTLSSPPAVVHLATQSRHHGWHAGLWRDALPDSPSLEADTTIAPPDAGWERAVQLVQGMDEAPDAARLAVLYRGLLPRAFSRLAGLEELLGGPGDAHLTRIVGLVRPDLLHDAMGGHHLLELTLGDQHTIETAGSVTQALDQAFRT
ncbi:MAG: hypothetical protein ACC660_01650 [Acidimicrobiales bacterium]